MYKYLFLFFNLLLISNINAQIDVSVGTKTVYTKEPIFNDTSMNLVTEVMFTPTVTFKINQKYTDTEIELSFSDKSIPQWKIDLELLVRPLNLISDNTLKFDLGVGVAFDYDIGYQNIASSSFVINTDFLVPIMNLETWIGFEYNHDIGNLNTIFQERHSRLEIYIFLPFANK